MFYTECQWVGGSRSASYDIHAYVQKLPLGELNVYVVAISISGPYSVSAIPTCTAQEEITIYIHRYWAYFKRAWMKYKYCSRPPLKVVRVQPACICSLVMSDLELCFCDDCGSGGSPQCRSTLAIHRKAQNARDRTHNAHRALVGTHEFSGTPLLSNIPENPGDTCEPYRNTSGPSEIPIARWFVILRPSDTYS